MPDKGGLQLLPDTRKKIDIRVPGQNRWITIGIVVFVLVMVVYGGLAWYSSMLETQVSDADQQLAALEAQRNKGAEQNLLTLAKEITTTAQIVKNHVYWSTGLSKIEAELQPSVRFEAFNANAVDGTLQFRALSDNYTTISHQLAAFVADDSVKDVSLDNVTVLTNGKLDFNSKITFNPSKFLVPLIPAK